MAEALPQRGVLRVVPPAALTAQIDAADKAKADAADAQANPSPAMGNLASFVRQQYEVFRTHRNNASAGWSERLLIALRAFNGQYPADKLNEIKKFGGSEVYSRVIAMKCRGASSLLRDVYLGAERPWGVAAPPDPSIPPEIVASVKQLVASELQNLQQAGAPASPDVIRDRVTQLMTSARQAAKKKAADQADIAEDKIDELLVEGGFYKALAEFIVDLPLFPFACIKGPVVKIVPTVQWTNGAAVVAQKPRMFWERVSPFDIWFTPGVTDIEDAAVIERSRFTRSNLNDCLDLPGYNTDEVRAVLDEYGRGGLSDTWDATDSERAVMENRENPLWNRSGLITCLIYSGNVQGRLLLEQGMTEKDGVTDELRDYMVQAYLIGTHIIKVQLSPSPRKRHQYYVTSFEKVPGTPVGNGLPDILADINDVANAALRSLVNNLAIASGPQVVINDDRLTNDADSENLYPWKRWHVTDSPMGNTSQVPISFFQPVSNSQDLLNVYNQFNQIADDLSAIPKYLAGGGAGGAGRTASGLAMLMGNASKILQTVAANVDRDVFDPLLTDLFDMIMLTDTSGLLTGEETVRVKGVNVAVQKETQRSRQIEFLATTANPIDQQIMGPKGRAVVLRSVSKDIGIEGEKIVPDDEELEQMHQQQMQMQQEQAQLGAQAQGSQQGPVATNDTGPRTRVTGGAG